MSGQETIYDPEYHIPLLIDLFEEGKDIYNFCAIAEISDTCFRKWRKRYKAFEEAYEYALQLAHCAWTRFALTGLVDSKIWHTIMKNRFGYTDSRRLKLKLLQKAESFDSQFDAVKSEVCEGNISIQEALHLSGMIATGSQIHQGTKLAEDVEKLKEITGGFNGG
jgi:hypothetical protein